jgi:septum formation protein
LLQPAQVPARVDREERSRHHRQESADRYLSKPVLVLASASPRRRELLGRLGVAFEVQASHIPEHHPPGPPAEAIIAVALAKALAVAAALDPGRTPAVVLGADTEVVLDGRLLGKPQDPADAARMLRELRGREHQVITGLAVVEVGPPGSAPRRETASVTSRVRMGDYSEAEVERYVATGEPLDKAGGYAVQGLGGRLVAAVDGCLTNVVGLPLTTTRALLERRGLL